MSYQNETLPENLIKVGSTARMTEETALPGLLKNHATSKGKYGFLVVESGRLQFVWEDGDIVLEADPNHPIVIFPERRHHLQFTGKVTFHVEFYEADPSPNVV